jgi:type IV secretion system protein VirD4
MYTLSRLLLALTVLLAAYCLAVAVAVAWPYSLYVLGFVVVARLAKEGRQRLTAFGTGRWANGADLRRQGMLDARQGLILGRMGKEGISGLMRAVRALLNPCVGAGDACRQFIWALRSMPVWRTQGPLVRLPQAVHTAVFAPTGVGKGVSCVIPFLLTCEDSCVVVDFKGELATITAQHRRRMGHDIVILDPFKVVTS